MFHFITAILSLHFACAVALGDGRFTQFSVYKWVKSHGSLDIRARAIKKSNRLVGDGVRKRRCQSEEG
jgi:hypothetical protein